MGPGDARWAVRGRHELPASGAAMTDHAYCEVLASTQFESTRAGGVLGVLPERAAGLRAGVSRRRPWERQRSTAPERRSTATPRLASGPSDVYIFRTYVARPSAQPWPPAGGAPRTASQAVSHGWEPGCSATEGVPAAGHRGPHPARGRRHRARAGSVAMAGRVPDVPRERAGSRRAPTASGAHPATTLGLLT